MKQPTHSGRLAVVYEASGGGEDSSRSRFTGRLEAPSGNSSRGRWSGDVSRGSRVASELALRCWICFAGVGCTSKQEAD